MADETEKKRKPRGIAADMVRGVNEIKNPGYTAYKREAVANGEEPMTPEEWAKKNPRRK
jgi:hypothetical protein